MGSDLSQLSAPAAYFRLAWESSRRAIALTDRDFRIYFVNAKAERLFGRPQRDLVGIHLNSLISLSFTEPAVPGASWTIAGLAERNGTVTPLEIDLHAFEAEGAVWMLGFIEDISERRKVESAYGENEERFREIANNSSVMICCSGPDRRATFFNTAWLGFTGRSMEQEVGFGWAESIHPEDRDRALAAYTSCFDARRHCYLEYRLRRAGGDYRWIVCSGVPRFTPEGDFVGYIASCLDATDERRAYERAVAVGVAHDFNNLFGGILALTENAMAALEEGAQIEEELRSIQRATLRGAELVDRLAAGSLNMDRKPERNPNPSSSSAPALTGETAQSLTILLVEDEDLLRIAVAKGLKKRGLAVIEARDGAEAVDILLTHSGAIDAMLLDLTLPGVSSRDVFLKARSERPEMKVIVTSAHPKTAVDSFFEGLSISLFIRKPYSVADLTHLVRSL